MSLINEALKKAQKLRTDERATDAPPMPGGGARVTKRAQARSANTMVLLGSGAVVLIVLSVVATVYLVNRPATPARVANATASTAATKATSIPAIPESPPLIVSTAATPPAPTLSPDTVAGAPVRPVSSPQDKPAAVPLSTRPAPVLPPASAASNIASPALPLSLPPTPIVPAAPTSVTAAPSLPAAPAISRPDDRIVTFVETLKVTGIRSSGDDSRVLMNARVYRVNDIVDRTLGVRLVGIAADSLTFADGNGQTYVKHF